MITINKLNENKNLSLALGFFDGVHIAHKKLILKTVEIAKNSGLKSAVITFKKAPAECFGAEPSYITTNEKKTLLLAELGVDYIYMLDFCEFKDMDAKDYIENVIIKYFSPKFVITGYNHLFGCERKGDCKLLESYGEHFEHIKINEIKQNNITVSSTNVKDFIKAGDFKNANKMLGRNFSVSGTVIRGNQIARQLGYKTANLIWPKNIVKPPYGAYFGFVNLNEKKYNAVINFGVRPSIDRSLKETLEAHILTFDADIYGKSIDVEFSYKIRDEIKFNSQDELKRQIEKDISSII